MKIVGSLREVGSWAGERGCEGRDSMGSSVTSCESAASSRRFTDLLLLLVTSPSEIDDTESASFPAIPSSRILLFPELHIESDSSAGTTTDLVARFARLVPRFLVSLGIVLLPELANVACSKPKSVIVK